MKELVKTLQRISYEILCDVDRYCRENDIPYYLSGGSCLGAVRHQGFIPWDDDVDIMLPRKDYQRLIEGFSRAHTDRYRLSSLQTDPDWIRPYARIWDTRTQLIQITSREKPMGVFIDVFPIDGLPAGKLARRLYFRRLKLADILRSAARRKVFLPHEKWRLPKRILGLLVRPFGPRFFAQRLERLACRYDFDRSEYVAASMAVHYWDRECIERSCMDRAVELQFGDRKFPAPIGYDRYLRNLYGDYMQIPPDAAEKGYSHLENWSVGWVGRADSHQLPRS